MAETTYIGEERRHLPRTPVSELCYNRFGFATNPRQRNVTCGTTVTELVPHNGNRLALILVNNSASVVYIGFDNDVATTNSLPLAANGGNFSMTWKEMGEAVTASIYGVAGAADLTMTLIEVVAEGT